MGKNSRNPDPPNCKKYGVPIYGASWVPNRIVKSDPNLTQADNSSDDNDEVSGDGSSLSPPSIAAENYLVFSGGGSEGRSGIPNALLLAHFDLASNSLSDQPNLHFQVQTNFFMRKPAKDFPYHQVAKI